jgi:3-dehydroquinate dehydratase-2
MNDKPIRLLVINGPNLNFLGIREPEHYGKLLYSGLVAGIAEHAKALGVEVKCLQSNHTSI